MKTMRAIRHRFMGAIVILLGILTVAPPPMPEVIKFNEHPFTKRTYGKAINSPSGGILASALQAIRSLGARVTAALQPLPHPTDLVGAGRFADADVLEDILELEDVQYYVDNTNPLEQLTGERGLLGDALFPDQRTEELTFNYLKGGSGGVVTAHIVHHNSEAPLISRKGVERVSGEIPAIKVKRHKDAQTLILLQGSTDAARDRAIDDIFDDVSAVRDGTTARTEKLRMDALAYGVATHQSEEGLRFSVDFQVPNGHKETLAGSDLWSHVDSDPLGDLEGAVNTMVADQGIRPERIATGSGPRNAFLAHASVRKAIYGVNYDRRLRVDEVNEFLAQQDLPQFLAPYDITVQQEALDGTRTSMRLFPNDRITLLPPASRGPLGATFRAPTAEEATQSLADGVIVIDGKRIAVHVYLATQDPKGVVTLGVASAFPSFDAADDVYLMKVL